LFCQEAPPDTDKMVSRQLNETKYICREAAKYLAPVCGEVQPTKGGATAMLRKHWGLMAALFDSNEKSRDDLRHHAIDAVAIAFTSRSLFQKITTERKRATQAGDRDLKVTPLSDQTCPPAPAWLFGQLRQKIADVVVSHETTRSIRDAFHEETALGIRNPEKGVFHVRKPLAAMTEGDLNDIVDPGLRAAAWQAFVAAGHDAKKAFADESGFGPTKAKRARIIKVITKAPMLSLGGNNVNKFFLLGNYHHVEILENVENGERQMRCVTTLEVATRVRQKGLPLVDTTPPSSGWRFVMWLCPGDVIRVDEQNGALYKLRVIAGTNNVLRFWKIEAANQSDTSNRLMKTPNTLRAVKVDVDALGRVREIPEGTV
jgi:CRISPR-associated endonuclease Csn1